MRRLLTAVLGLLVVVLGSTAATPADAQVVVIPNGNSVNYTGAPITLNASAGNNQFGPSEANAVIGRLGQLSSTEQQDLLNFLRSL